MNYRFRVNEDGALVLQVLEQSERYSYGYGGTATWRDAKVSDIPVSDPFRIHGAAKYGYDADTGGWERLP